MNFDKTFSIFALLFLILTFLFKIFLVSNSIIGFDEAGISYIAKEMTAGKSLYTDYFDHKPPLMHYLLSIFFNFIEPSNFSIKLTALILDTALLLSIFFVGKNFLPPKYAFYAASFYSVFNLNLSMNTEIVMTIFGLWAFFFYIKALKKDKLPNLLLFTSGVLIAISIWFKQSALFFYIPILIHIFLLKIKTKEKINSALVFTLGVLLVSIPLLSYFLLTVGLDFLYAILTFNLQFETASSRILQLGKGLNLLLANLGALLAIILSGFFQKREGKRVESILLTFNILILIFILLSKEIFMQHFYQLIPFTILLTLVIVKSSEKNLKSLMFIILIVSSLTIFLTIAEANVREIRSGSLEKQQEILSFLEENVPQESNFFSDNSIYTLLGDYNLNQPLVHSAPSFNSVFDYGFTCNQDYLVMTHRQKFLTEEELECISNNFEKIQTFDDVGESFVEIWKKT